MFTATFKGFERFAEVGADLDRVCLEALNEAAVVAATTAAGSASLDLDIRVQPAIPVVDGFTAGIRSEKRGKRGTRIAPFFDAGTLGRHRGKLKGSRRDSWTVNRGGSSFTATRQPITADEGIPAERFFIKGRLEGRKALLSRIDRGF